MGKTDRVLSANSRNAFCGLECMRNMQKASSYRVSSITRLRTKSRIDRKDKTSSGDQDYLQDGELILDDELAQSGYTKEEKSKSFEEEFDFEQEFQEEEKPPATIDRLSQQVYIRACKTLGHSPVTAYLRDLTTESIVLKHHVLGPERIKACAIALVANTTVKELNLQDNDVGEIGAIYLAEMLEENCCISDLTISFNNIGREGLQNLSYAIQRNDTITKLDLSGNNFEDIDAKYIVAILEENPLIRELRIHHNRFLMSGAILLSETLGHIDNLELLDLSWNHIRCKGAVAICEGLSKNCSITDLNLSWNGFGLVGCKALSKALSENSTIAHLDISCNRIDLAALKELVCGLQLNKSVTSIKLSENPLTAEGALLLLSMLEDSTTKMIKEIDISSQTVSTEFCQKLENLQQSRKIRIKYGRMIEVDYGEKTASDSFEKEDPMMVLMEFMRIRNFRLIDLFKSLDSDGSHSLTRKEFKEGLQSVNIPMSSASIDKLLDLLDQDKDGEVDFTELIQGQKRHKARVRHMKQKEKDLPPEKSELARINAKLQHLMSFRRRTLHKIEFKRSDSMAITEENED